MQPLQPQREHAHVERWRNQGELGPPCGRGGARIGIATLGKGIGGFSMPPASLPGKEGREEAISGNASAARSLTPRTTEP
jgi:hypothetical protein